MACCEDQQGMEVLFGPLLAISDESLVALVSSALKKIPDKLPPSTGRVISRENGSYNLVHIIEFDDDLKYVVRVPVTGWNGQFTETVQRSFTSQALTMRFVRKETTIPVPEIYAFDITSANAIGAPYILMSFVPGFPASTLWFDETGPTPLEERRMRILDSVAQAMSQLQKFQFDKIGALKFDPESSADTVTVGPCYQWDGSDFEDEDDDCEKKIGVIEFGPFETSKSYL